MTALAACGAHVASVPGQLRCARPAGHAGRCDATPDNPADRCTCEHARHLPGGCARTAWHSVATTYGAFRVCGACARYCPGYSGGGR